MFERTTPGGKRIAVGSGVPKDWTPGPRRPRKAAAKKVEPEPAPEPVPEPESPEDEAPKQTDLKADWVQYAVTQGADPVKAEELTKVELIEKYGGE